MVTRLGVLGIGLLLGGLVAAHAASPPPRGAAERGLIVADITAPPPNLDPFRVYGTQAQSLFRLVFEPLVDRDPQGKLRTPLLESWGQVDPLTWEFRVRPGIRFHDGGELTAADVAFSLRRILDPASPRRHDFSELESVTAVDARTLRITLRRPYALLPARLAQFSMIVPDQLRGRPEAEFFKQPIGLGPFRLTDLNSTQAVLTAFPEHHGGPPRVPRVVFRFLADPEERLSQLLGGGVDLVTNLLPQQVDQVVQARGAKLLKRHSIRFINVLIETQRGPLARPEVRRALLHGTEVPNLVRYVARGNGRHIATVTLPEDFGFNEKLKPYEFDAPRARALLAEAGYPKGFRLRGLAFHETQTVATALATQWSKLGVELEVESDARSAAISRWIKERDRHDFLIGDPTSILFDAAFQLRVTLDPAHPMARAASPRALDLLNQSDAEQNPARRAGLLRDVQAIVHEQALIMPLYQVVDLYGMRDAVRNFVPSADTILRLDEVTLGP
jgi:peptide/nickel transport system substrate-binding protein